MEASNFTFAWDQLIDRVIYVDTRADFFHHCYRSNTWYVINDKTSGAYYRCSESVYWFLRLLDGKCTLRDAINNFDSLHTDKKLDKKDLFEALALLYEGDLLLGDLPSSGLRMVEKKNKNRRRRISQFLIRPTMFKVGIWNPDRFLNRLLPFFDSAFSLFGLSLFLGLVVFALLQLDANWLSVKSHWETRFFDPLNLLMLWVQFPLLKLLHELGHGLATKKWGGHVYELGVMFIVFTPVPYVDASSSTAFPHKQQRMVVAASGIIVEIMVAAIAFIVWLNTNSLFIKDLCFNWMLIGGVSTLLFNGNPLLRFDGYFVLADFLEIPNLASRSNQYYSYVFRTYVLGSKSVNSPVTAKGERSWFVFYGFASTLYRLYIAYIIVVFIASKFFVFGLLFALWVFVGQIIIPWAISCWRTIQFAKSEKLLVRLGVTSVFAIATLYIVTFFLPVSSVSSASGVVQSEDRYQIKVNTSGFIKEVLIDEGERIDEGTTLLQLEDKNLAVEEFLAQAKLNELRVKKNRTLLDDPIETQILVKDIDILNRKLQDIKEQRLNLQVVSRASGNVALNLNKEDLIGRFYKKGSIIGQVVNKTNREIVIYVKEAQLVRLESFDGDILVRFHSLPNKEFAASILSSEPTLAKTLPTKVLGTLAGGPIAVDASSESGVRAIETLYEIRLLVAQIPSSVPLGRLEVKFVHAKESIGDKIGRAIRKIFFEKLKL